MGSFPFFSVWVTAPLRGTDPINATQEILLNEGMATLALPRTVPVGNKQHLASTTPAAGVPQTKAFTASQAP